MADAVLKTKTVQPKATAVKTELNPKTPERITGTAAPIPQLINNPVSEPIKAKAQARLELIKRPKAKKPPVTAFCQFALN